jgi:SAM-dependent methyltransferase
VRLDQRVPEPELMEDLQQATAYSDADFAAPHQAVVEHLLERRPTAPADVRTVVDLGCGPADVTVRFARALPGARVVGLDAGPTMLALGRARVERLGVDDRVELHQLHLPADDTVLAGFGRFDMVVSNSLLHHLHDPRSLWHAVTALGAPGAVVHVVDLRRPTHHHEVDRLVATHADGEAPVLVEDFRRSLLAAYRPDEVEAQLVAAGLDGTLRVEVVSDRHLLVHGRLPDDA